MPREEGPGSAPAIVLVEPQLAENIGAAARAMANFGLADLRLVAPRDGWPDEKARAAASGADRIVDAARVHDTLAEALADLSFVLATTARTRAIPKDVRAPREAAAGLRARQARGQATGVLFGRERWGLTNEEVSLADEIVTFPVTPEFASLNIAQAVLLMSYEWMMSGLRPDELPTRFALPDRDDPPATKADLNGLIAHLEAALEKAGYFRPADMKPVKVQNLRAILQRRQFTTPEIQVLRGVVASLERRHERSGRK